jgi:hypothetical protein
MAMPITITAPNDNGIRINTFVFKPIKKINEVPINLSHFYSMIIVKVPIVVGSCNN